MEFLSKWTIRLNDGVGKCGVDRFREAFEPIDHGQQDVLDAAVLEFVHHPEPEFGAFILLDPHAQNGFGAIGHDAQRNMDCLVADQPFVADLDPNGIKENKRIDGIQRTLLPGCNLIEHRVGDRADQIC
jgi:hypothetical protein